jgi:hypothetical protein
MNFVPPLAGSVNLAMGLVIAAVAIGVTVRAALLARQGKQIFPHRWAVRPIGPCADCSATSILPTISPMKFSLLAIAVGLVIPICLFARNQKDESQMSSTSFVVLKDDNGKPVRNAAVVLHPVGKHDKQAKNGFELKTDADGKTYFDGIPYGLLRVQVIAHGFQTFGSDYQINQPKQEITIRLKQPQNQYSIYDKPAASNTGTNTGGTNGTSSGTPPPPDKQ